MSAHPTDESNIGIYLWLFMLADFAITIIVIDVWLYKNGHEMLTTEFKEGLRNPWLGWLLAGVTGGVVCAFAWHMWNTRDGSTARFK